MAKCTLSKVKIEPMLVAGCVCGVSRQPHSACDMMEDDRKGLTPPLPFAGVAPCFCACESCDSVDRCGSLAVVLRAFTDKLLRLLRVHADSS